ncbi:hypothetical protein RRH01S_14_01770 [Rhizobium rhizogenes NBRC 13257]|uniref:Uncharacterized protein n=1 Tax=Rhizobium rhizogenes NBRC 13257 TaxID=1220581 RepID=A0AA87QJV5_RHIRH|nr:hypothetical protein RRH01S_14_01770 [Rhizobium rhizogenes NBRC 13257]
MSVVISVVPWGYGRQLAIERLTQLTADSASPLEETPVTRLRRCAERLGRSRWIATKGGTAALSVSTS